MIDVEIIALTGIDFQFIYTADYAGYIRSSSAPGSEITRG
jgi:hypothetical protein